MISSDYRQLYGLTVARAARLSEDTIIMHPDDQPRPGDRQ
jgi:hypothetical protein